MPAYNAERRNKMPTREQVIEIAKQCFDPEIPVNVWDLGLIYEINVDPTADRVNIEMSLTSQACPAAQQIPDQLKSKITSGLGVKEVNVKVVFDPPWTPE